MLHGFERSFCKDGVNRYVLFPAVGIIFQNVKLRPFGGRWGTVIN